MTADELISFPAYILIWKDAVSTAPDVSARGYPRGHRYTPRAHLSHTLLPSSIQAGVSEWERVTQRLHPSGNYTRSEPTEPAHQTHSPLYRYPPNVPTVAKSYFRCLCWDFKGTYVDLVGSKRKKWKGGWLRWRMSWGSSRAGRTGRCFFSALSCRSQRAQISLAPRASHQYARMKRTRSQQLLSAVILEVHRTAALNGNGDLMELNFPPKRTKRLLSCPGERNCRTRTYPERNGRAQLKKKTEKFIQQRKPKWSGEKSAICMRLTARPVLGSSSGVPEQLTVPGRARSRTSHTWSRPPLRCLETRLIIRPWCCGPDTTAAWV